MANGTHSEQTKTTTWYIALAVIAQKELDHGSEVGQILELNMLPVPVTQEEQHTRKQEEMANTVGRPEQ